MKACVVFVAAMCCALLTGCVHHHHGHAPHGAKVILPAPKVLVPVPVVVDTKGGSKHCPPGQAKKGNC